MLKDKKPLKKKVTPLYYYMMLALKEAQKAFLKGEVPVGAVIVDSKNDKIISKAYNKVITNNNPTHHAEILAITKATKKIKNYRLTDLDLYVTLEPCPMCAGAIIHSRIKRLYFGAYDVKGGAIVNNINIFSKNYSYNHKSHYTGGILEIESVKLLNDFFKNLRNK